MLPIVLASASPYRANMLKELGYDFRVHKTDIDEVWQAGLTPVEAVEDIAKQKALAAAPLFPQALVITADTIVVNARSRILLKPRSIQEAQSFLRERSGSSEQVITGFCLMTQKQTYLGSEISHIRYKKIPASLQEQIMRSNEWQNVCGGLKIEGLIAPYVKSIKGSRTNIMGLPTERIAPLLDKLQEKNSSVL